jgi:hypothetical protein
MIISVVAVGDSAQDWHETPCDLSIGCNDMKKWGQDPDWLVLVNVPRKFLKRLEVIKQTQAKRILVSSLKEWIRYFPKAERLRRLVEYHQRTRVRIGAHYTLRTSPIICISLALEAGATDIILWGVDFTFHKVNAGTKSGEREIELYKDFFKKVEALGVTIWRGANGSVFDNVIPLYEQA